MICFSQYFTCIFSAFWVINPLSFYCIATITGLLFAMSYYFCNRPVINSPKLHQFAITQFFFKVTKFKGITNIHTFQKFYSVYDFFRKTFFHNKYILVTNKSTKKYKGKVYNLSVWKDESYITELGITHNCRCVATEVLAKDKTKSDSKKAIEQGQHATSHIGKNGKNKLAMFRFNPGQNKKVFPPNHSYKPKYCSNGKAQLNFESVFLSLEDERCKALKEIEEQARRNFETWEDVKTKKGQLKVSSKHGKNEKTENIEIASHFTNKYGHKIRLLGRSNIEKTADAFNETLGIKQEYKRNKKPTRSAIDNEIRSAKNQADHIVLDIQSEITRGDLRKAIQSRTRRSENIKEIIVIRNGQDKVYTREQIIKDDWQL
ncbi:hypothetical protein GO491_03185 [Flavobacteriaceae bacterium Ap0902]|nr:hypothetical protein [Flavobacteriaceae bacterium Ap0902]